MAQQPLTIVNAIDIAIVNNFDIRIAKNNTEISKINNSFGVAGGLPTVGITASDNNSLYNLDQKLSSGVDITKSNVSTNSFNSGLTASMVLFNGFKIVATREKLNLLQSQSELELNQQIQNTIAAVMVTYYDILRQQRYLQIIQSSLEVSSQELDIVKTRIIVGMANDADLLQAQMDLSMAEQNIQSQQVVIAQEKINLLTLMGMKQFYDVNIYDTILIDRNIRKDTILNYLKNNPQYLSASRQIRINEQIVKELKAQRYPSVRVNTGYNFIYNSSTAGFNLFTQNYGPVLGASLQIPIYNGKIYSSQQHVASYNVKNSALQQESLFTSLKADALKTYQSYESTLQQLEAQQTNYQNAEKLVNLVLQRFQLNQATILDVKAARASYEGAGYMLVNLQYAAKIAEIELKRLIYQLGY
jgi:outer membrane protein TolC